MHQSNHEQNLDEFFQQEEEYTVCPTCSGIHPVREECGCDDAE